MKPLFRYILTVLLFANAACENKDTEKPYIDQEPSMVMVYVRFAADSATQFVIAESFDDESATMRGKPGVCQDMVLGTLPYKYVSKGYYIVDWKWGYFLYRPSNVILNLTWYDLEDWNHVWRLDETGTHDQSMLGEYGVIRRKKIDEYLNIAYQEENYAIPDLYGDVVDREEIEAAGYDEEKYMMNIHVQDSLQNIYIDRLKEIIQKDALGNVALYKVE